jgi:hypothetical protein
MSQVLSAFIANLILILIYFPFLEIMVSRMATSYGFQIAQMNEKPSPESFLDLTLMQHPYDEDPNLREVRACLEVDPF